MIILLASLAVFLALGIPIAYSLGLSGFLYFVFEHPGLVSILPPRFLAGMDSYAMIALPLFVLMGLLMNAGGITSRLINFSLLFVGRFRGGLGAVNVFASMIFGGISGSSVSDTASVGAVLIPEMKKKGYTAEFASGITVASSTMGMIIPPSVPMIIYALVSEESVGKLFLGSLIPGIMIGVLMLGITLSVSYAKKYPREEVLLTGKEKLATARQSILAIIMPVFVVGAVVFGIATPTESAGLGVLYAFIIGAFIIRDLKFKAIPPLMRDAILTSANVMVIIALSKLYIWILALERIPQTVALVYFRAGSAGLCDIAIYRYHHSGYRNFCGCEPGDSFAHTGFPAGHGCAGGFPHPVRCDSDIRSGRRPGNTAGGDVFECGFGYFKTGYRHHISCCPAVSSGQYHYLNIDYIYSTSEYVASRIIF